MKGLELVAVLLLAILQSRSNEFCTVEGTVLNAATGNPLAGASVQIVPAIPPSPTNGPLSPHFVTTDSSGHFIADHILPSSYMVYATSNGYVRQGYGQRGTVANSAKPVELTSGQHLKDVVFRLTPTGVVTGRVVDATGQPVANLDINLLKVAYDTEGQKTFRSQQSARTNDLGEYRLFWVTPGRYYLEAEISQRGPGSFNLNASGAPQNYAPTYYPGTLDSSKAESIEVSSAAVVAIDLMVTASRAFAIRGRVVVDASLAGRGTPSIGLQRRTITGGTSTTGRPINADGSFAIPDVLPGIYTLVATLNDVVTDRRLTPQSPRVTSQVQVEVNGSDVERITLVLSPGIDIRGYVRVEGQQTGSSPDFLRRLHPILRTGNGMTQGVVFSSSTPVSEVGSDGSFTIPQMTPGTYQVSILGMPADYFVRSARMGTLDALRDGLTIERSIETALEIVLSASGARIEGTVVDDNRRPVAGATLTLIPQDRNRGDLYKTAVTDAKGGYVIRGIPPGEYKMFAWDALEPGAQRDPDFLNKYEVLGKTIRVTEGGLEQLEFRAIPGA